MSEFLTTKEVAAYLRINEKRVYSLVENGGLPASKATGKWLFPKHLVRAWLESQTLNHPKRRGVLDRTPSLLVVAGSNDPLLERCLDLFMRRAPEYTGVFGNLGSMGGIRSLRQGLCHIATSHLAQEDGREYNFSYLSRELEEQPAVIEFCRREQGLLLPRGNPLGIEVVADVARRDLSIVTRQPGTGTRLWFDRALKQAGFPPEQLRGGSREMPRHLDAGLEVLAGRADAAPGIRAVAGLLELDFLPVHWERFDLLIDKETFFQKPIQAFLATLHEDAFHEEAKRLTGYDLAQSSQMVYPAPDQEKE